MAHLDAQVREPVSVARQAVDSRIHKALRVAAEDFGEERSSLEPFALEAWYETEYS